jgi:hypothetical protein
LILIAACGVLALVPSIEIVVVPEWPMRVVDTAGNPVAGAEVRQHWNHYSFNASGTGDAYGGEEILASDANGQIVFPERSFRVGLLSLALSKIGGPFRWFDLHASTGPSAYFVCYNVSCRYSEPTYRGEPEELLNTVIVVHQAQK